jgi:hypothetical protein
MNPLASTPPSLRFTTPCSSAFNLSLMLNAFPFPFPCCAFELLLVNFPAALGVNVPAE